MTSSEHSGVAFKPDTSESRRKFNELARHQFIVRMLGEIQLDMMVCEIEGWDKLEFIRQIQAEINRFGK